MSAMWAAWSAGTKDMTGVRPASDAAAPRCSFPRPDRRIEIPLCERAGIDSSQHARALRDRRVIEVSFGNLMADLPRRFLHVREEQMQPARKDVLDPVV